MAQLAYKLSDDGGNTFSKVFYYSSYKSGTPAIPASPGDVFQTPGTDLFELIDYQIGNHSFQFENGKTLDVNLSYDGIHYSLAVLIQGLIYDASGSWVDTSLSNAHYYVGVYPNGDYTLPIAKYGQMRYQPSNNVWKYSIIDILSQSALKAYFDSMVPMEIFDTSSQEGGGYGLPDWTSDTINVPALPLVSVLDSGMVTMYEVSMAEAKSLAQYLWTGTFFDNVKKMFQSPMDAIIGFSSVPFTPTGTPNSEIKVSWINTGCFGEKLSAQYYELNFGEIDISEMWNTFLDYNGTKIDIYLPYLSVKSIDPQDVMGGKIGLIYHIDIWTGAFVAFLTSKRKRGNEVLDAVLYQWSGNCASEYPISARDWTGLYKTVVDTALTAGLALSAPAVAGATAAAKTAKKASTLAGVGATAMNAGTSVSHSDGGSCNIGMLGVLRPYVCISRPQIAIPENYGKLAGYTAPLTRTLSSCSGLTVVSECHVDSIANATAEEKAEIETLLKEGIII